MHGIELELCEKDALSKLYSNLIYEVEKSSVIKKYNPNSIVNELLIVTKNNRSSIFTNISIHLTSDISQNLLNLELIQCISVQGIKKWTFTLKGLAYNIAILEQISFNDQYFSLLKNFDNKFNLESNKRLDWKEKLVTLSLILMVSTSQASAIMLDNSSNRELFEEVLGKTLSCLNRYKINDKKRKLPKSRGEPPATLIMRSRVNDLPAKTNHVYVNLGGGDGYYLDIEQEKGLDKDKMWFLLNLIFEKFDGSIKYGELKDELILISEQYSPQMLTRNVDSRLLFGILNKLDEYFNIEIHNLPYND